MIAVSILAVASLRSLKTTKAVLTAMKLGVTLEGSPGTSSITFHLFHD
jgi:hypothetical protein